MEMHEMAETIARARIAPGLLLNGEWPTAEVVLAAARGERSTLERWYATALDCLGDPDALLT
jgi:hypothetical protein